MTTGSDNKTQTHFNPQTGLLPCPHLLCTQLLAAKKSAACSKLQKGQDTRRPPVGEGRPQAERCPACVPRAFGIFLLVLGWMWIPKVKPKTELQ